MIFPNSPVPEIPLDCILVPKFSKLSLKTCPNGWKLIFTEDWNPYDFPSDLREFKEGNLHFDCSRKTWSKKC